MYSVRTAMERLNTQTFHLGRVTGKLSKSRRNDGHRVADLFPNEPRWLTYSDILRRVSKSSVLRWRSRASLKYHFVNPSKKCSYKTQYN